MSEYEGLPFSRKEAKAAYRLSALISFAKSSVFISCTVRCLATPFSWWIVCCSYAPTVTMKGHVE